MVSADTILQQLLTTYPGGQLHYERGAKMISYNPEKKLAQGIVFASVREEKETGRVMVGLWVRKQTFQRILQEEGSPDGIDSLIPHPEHQNVHWIATVNPEEKTVRRIMALLKESIALAKDKFDDKLKRRSEIFTRNALPKMLI